MYSLGRALVKASISRESDSRSSPPAEHLTALKMSHLCCSVIHPECLHAQSTNQSSAMLAKSASWQLYNTVRAALWPGPH